MQSQKFAGPQPHASGFPAAQHPGLIIPLRYLPRTVPAGVASGLNSVGFHIFFFPFAEVILHCQLHFFTICNTNTLADNKLQHRTTWQHRENGQKIPKREGKKKCDELTVLSTYERNVKEKLPEMKGALQGLSMAPRRGDLPREAASA